MYACLWWLKYRFKNLRWNSHFEKNIDCRTQTHCTTLYCYMHKVWWDLNVILCEIVNSNVINTKQYIKKSK